MKTVTNIQENAGDIYAEAQQINDTRENAEEYADESVAEEAATETEAPEA